MALFTEEERQDLREVAMLGKPALEKIRHLLSAMDKQLEQAKSAYDKVRSDPYMAPQIDNLQSALQQIATLAKVGARRIEHYK